MNQQELKNVLEMHRKWITGEPEGKRADLSYADLRYANLRYADLRYADLRSANLRYADLSYADLYYADLSSADLRSANLYYADLSSAYLRSIKEDFFKRLTIARTEAVGLYDHLMRGKINGLAYAGECACFVGTIANLRKEDHLNLSIDLKADASSATERWFLGIRQGDTPDNNPVSKITSEWFEEFFNSNNIVVPKYKLISSLDKPDLFEG